MKSLEFETIFTIDARTNVYLEVMADHFGLSERQVRSAIQQSFQVLSVAVEPRIDSIQFRGFYRNLRQNGLADTAGQIHFDSDRLG